MGEGSERIGVRYENVIMEAFTGFEDEKKAISREIMVPPKDGKGKEKDSTLVPLERIKILQYLDFNLMC